MTKCIFSYIPIRILQMGVHFYNNIMWNFRFSYLFFLYNFKVRLHFLSLNNFVLGREYNLSRST